MKSSGISINFFKMVSAVCLLLSMGNTPSWGQELDSKPQKWYHGLKDYLYGRPWQYDSLLHTTHTKLLASFGQQRVLDAYLSPTVHIGEDIRFRVLTSSPKRQHKWYWNQEVELLMSFPTNRANGSVMYHFGGEYMLGPLFDVFQRSCFKLSVGPALDVNTKGNLKLSNTNNVFNLKASVGLDGQMRGVYLAHLWGYPLALSYTTQLSLFHFTFSPEYGQSYYGYISEQNKKPLRFVPSLPHQRFNLKQRLLIDLPIHHATLTLGVEHLYHNAMIHNLAYKESHVSLLVGYSFDFVKMSGGRSMRSKSIKNSYNP